MNIEILKVSKIALSRSSILPRHGVQCRLISVVYCFGFLKLLFFAFFFALCDLVHDVETIFHLSYMLTAYGNLF